MIDSLGGEYCWRALDSEPIRLLKTPRSPSVYIINTIIQIFNFTREDRRLSRIEMIFIRFNLLKQTDRTCWTIQTHSDQLN